MSSAHTDTILDSEEPLEPPKNLKISQVAERLFAIGADLRLSEAGELKIDYPLSDNPGQHDYITWITRLYSTELTEYLKHCPRCYGEVFYEPQPGRKLCQGCHPLRAREMDILTRL